MLRLTKPVKKYLEFGMYCGGEYVGQHKYININIESETDMNQILPNRVVWIHAATTSQNTMDISLFCTFSADTYETSSKLVYDSAFSFKLFIFDLLSSHSELDQTYILYKDKDLNIDKIKTTRARVYGTGSFEWGSRSDKWNDPNDHPIAPLISDMNNGAIQLYIGEIPDFKEYNQWNHRIHYISIRASYTLHFLEPIFTSEYMKSGEKNFLIFIYLFIIILIRRYIHYVKRYSNY